MNPSLTCARCFHKTAAQALAFSFDALLPFAAAQRKYPYV